MLRRFGPAKLIESRVDTPRIGARFGNAEHVLEHIFTRGKATFALLRFRTAVLFFG